ncbi:MAG: hypothetical protein MSIBF_05515 [Candidatus Altiarchaeales archaeon IMC4]|nr:MAG: hypothetical protein MSIBF_05515 [Candidatus Altiarchaeales archaeon IMC4]
MRLLLDEKNGNRYLVNEEDLHTKYGVVKWDEVKDKKPGDRVETQTGRVYVILEPNLLDFMKKARRGPQTITLKDASIIAGFTGIHSGSRVLESGTGSGLLTMFLANLVYPEKLSTYELRQDFADIAEKNLRKAGIENVNLEVRDVYEGIDEKDLDVVIFDLPEPWKAVAHAKAALKAGGYLVIYSPSIGQVQEVYGHLLGFENRTVEVIMREWDVKVMRPEIQMIGHTAFLTFARFLG